jgi:hypothetical protein
MPFDSINFTNNAYAAAPRLASGHGLDKLYQDSIPQGVQAQFAVLIDHIESIAHETQFDMSASLQTVKNIFTHRDWKDKTQDVYHDLITSLEHTVLALIEAKENNNPSFIKNLLKLLAKEFALCSAGTPFIEGNYYCDAGQQLRANKHYAFSTPSLIDFLQHAPELAYVYEGAVVDLCCAYPPHKLGRFNYKRRPHTITIELQGQSNLDAIQVYIDELEDYLKKLKLLCNEADMGEKGQSIIDNIRLNLFFPFEARGEREEKLDIQPCDIFIDIKRKLEIIYVILDKKLKTHDTSLKQDVKATLRKIFQRTHIDLSFE